MLYVLLLIYYIENEYNITNFFRSQELQMSNDRHATVEYLRLHKIFYKEGELFAQQGSPL